jgi:hypothetical protein
VNNHVTLCLHVNKNGNNFRVVKFDIKADSVYHPVNKKQSKLSCERYKKQPLVDSIVFSYDVQFEVSPKVIGSRWDVYQTMGQQDIHWLSIVNSLGVMLGLGVLIGQVLRVMLKRDITRDEQSYRSVNLESQEMEDPDPNTWK